MQFYGECLMDFKITISIPGVRKPWHEQPYTQMVMSLRADGEHQQSLLKDLGDESSEFYKLFDTVTDSFNFEGDLSIEGCKHSWDLNGERKPVEDCMDSICWLGGFMQFHGFQLQVIQRICDPEEHVVHEKPGLGRRIHEKLLRKAFKIMGRDKDFEDDNLTP
jgi:hypothetical protein